MITVGSLFSGIAGIELGLERTGGFKTIWFVEKDPYCQAVLGKHWPRIPIYGDTRTIDWSRLERPDMLTGGFPCQPVSSAGKRRGKEDSRWLWPSYAKALRILRPNIVLMENVPNLATFNAEFGQILGDLAACGYDAQWQSVRASDVGAPHRRERIFIIAYADDSGTEWGSTQQGSGAEKRNVADSDIGRFTRSRIPIHGSQASETDLSGNGTDVSDANASRWHSPVGHVFSREFDIERSGWWETEPPVGRLANGISDGLGNAQLRCLGNAVVPQVAEAIGQMILSSMVEHNDGA